METAGENSDSCTSSIKMWPPSPNLRAIALKMMALTLSSSIFARSYGLLSKEEARDNAKRIEEASFATANDLFNKEPNGDGSSARRLYVIEGSRLVQELFQTISKRREYADFRPPRRTEFDISCSCRANVDAEEARKILSPLDEEGNSYTNICFNNRSFGIDAARVAAPILASSKGQLTQVDLSDFIGGRAEDEALEVMRIFSSALEGSVLKYLNLSGNALGEKGVRAFEPLLKSQNSLEELYLVNSNISKEAARALCELIPSAEKLRILRFHNNMMGDEGAAAISDIIRRSPLLEDFTCSSAQTGAEGGIVLAEALETCTHLKELDLRHNMFGADAAVALSRTIEKLVGIVKLYLSYLSLGDEGVIAISNALRGSVPSLEVLELAGNDITIKAASPLAACIATKQFLKGLVLSWNDLRDEGAVLIGKALEFGHGQLEQLDLSNNMIRREGARCLAKSVVSSVKPDFVVLNIKGNAISVEGIAEVKDILRAHDYIHVLGLLYENDAKEAKRRPEGEEAVVEGID